jgi:hypothetical protein
MKTVHLAADDKRHVLRLVIISSGNAAMDLELVQQGACKYAALRTACVKFHFLTVVTESARGDVVD